MSNVNVRSLSTISRRAAFVLLSCISLSAQDSKRSAAQDQPYTDDQVLQYAKSIDVAKLDPILPSQPLEEWLVRGPAQIDELNWWVSRDCDLKDAKPDRNGDLPLCVKIPFRRGNVSGIGMLRVGTLKHGIIGRADFQYLFGAIAPFSDRHFGGHYDRLSEFPGYLDAVAQSAAVGNCVQKDDSSRPDCPRALAFFREFQSELQSNNRRAVARMVAYPLLTTDHHRTVQITSGRGLLAHFDQIFNDRVRCLILHASEKDVWGNWQGFTLDSGAVWFDGILPLTEKADPTAPDYWTKYPFKIKTVNNGSEYPCNSSRTSHN